LVALTLQRLLNIQVPNLMSFSIT